MESMRLGETVMVSRFWTPDHIDLTDVPMTYARPKATWIDHLDQHRRFKAIDERDRLFRRRSHAMAFIDPAENTPSAGEDRVPFFENLGTMTNAFMGGRLAG